MRRLSSEEKALMTYALENFWKFSEKKRTAYWGISKYIREFAENRAREIAKYIRGLDPTLQSSDFIEVGKIALEIWLEEKDYTTPESFYSSVSYDVLNDSEKLKDLLHRNYIDFMRRVADKALARFQTSESNSR